MKYYIKRHIDTDYIEVDKWKYLHNQHKAGYMIDDDFIPMQSFYDEQHDISGYTEE